MIEAIIITAFKSEIIIFPALAPDFVFKFYS